MVPVGLRVADGPPAAWRGATGHPSDTAGPKHRRGWGYGGPRVRREQHECFAVQGRQPLAEQGAPCLAEVRSDPGWDVRTTTGTDHDLDASALCGESSEVASNALPSSATTTRARTVRSSTPATPSPVKAGGDDEIIKVNLATVLADVAMTVIPIPIHAATRAHHCGQVRHASIRVVNQASGVDIARYDLSEGAATETAMVFGELYRSGAEWEFRAGGQGCACGPSASSTTSASASGLRTPVPPSASPHGDIPSACGRRALPAGRRSRRPPPSPRPTSGALYVHQPHQGSEDQPDQVRHDSPQPRTDGAGMAAACAHGLPPQTDGPHGGRPRRLSGPVRGPQGRGGRLLPAPGRHLQCREALRRQPHRRRRCGGRRGDHG
ncbi:TerD family protein [Streptomyces sp. A1499]|nr:TerD family protein [Streptomyces sp. A1499]